MKTGEKLVRAIHAGKTADVEKILEGCDDREGNMALALTWAGWHGQLAIIKLLLDAGARANAMDSESLRHATERGHTRAMVLLLENHTDKELEELLKTELAFKPAVPKKIITAELEGRRRKRHRAEVNNIRDASVELEP